MSGKRSPRILVLLSGLSVPGGIQRYNRTLCRALRGYAASRGARLDVLTLHDPPGWHAPSYLPHPPVSAGGNRLLFAARAVVATAARYDLVIAGHVDLAPLAMPARLAFRNTRLLTLVYGIEVWSRLSAQKRAALYASDQIWSISEYTAQVVTPLNGLDRKSMRIVPIPLDPEFAAGVRPDVPPRLTSEGSKLLSITRLAAHDRDKGIDSVVKALADVRRRVPEVSYTIVGDGDDRPRLEALARESGVTDIVHFVGRLPDAELQNLLAEADLFVLPSRKEGFGIVFLEAMAHGIPVVAGLHGGIPEVVADRETGVLVRHGDERELADALAMLLSDSARRRRMGEAGRSRVRTVFGYERYVNTVEGLLDPLLSRGGSDA